MSHQDMLSAPVLRVLLVEHHPEDSERIRASLAEQRNVTLCQVTNLAEALSALSTQSFDLVLLEIDLAPGLSAGTADRPAISNPGPEEQRLAGTLMPLQRLRSATTVPVVLLGEQYEYRQVQAAFLAGAQDFLLKQHVRSFLYPALLNTLQRVRQGEALRLRQIQQEQQLITETIQQERKHTRQYLDIAEVMILALDAEGYITLVNRKAAEVLGCPQEELLGLSWFDNFLPHQLREPIRNIHDQLITAAPNCDVAHVENLILTRQGHQRLISWHNTPLLDKAGQCIGSLSSGEDITERKAAERALRESEQKYRLLSENTVDCIWIANLELIIIYVNKAIEKLLGFTAEEFVGTKLSDHCDETQYKRCAEIAVREMAKPPPIPSVIFEIVLLNKARQEVAVEIHASVLYDEQNRPLSFQGVTRDISERRKLQTNLAQADRLASMGLLAAGVAHEINNPLAYVLYNLEGLNHDLPQLLEAVHFHQRSLANTLHDEGREAGTSPKGILANPALPIELQQRFRDALHGTQRIRDIVRHLSTFSRVEQDVLVSVTIKHVVEVAINMAFNEIKYRAHLVKDFEQVPPVLASEGRLSQVFLNLLINAAHAIDEGAIEQNEIRVHIWPDGDEVCVEVRDTGKGIAIEHLEHLFEPFFTTKEVGVGSGLGLAISKNIVEGYGGRIEVQSEINRGTSFIVRLPASRATVADAHLAVQPAAKVNLTGRLLLIDDERRMRVSMKRMLRGYEVIEADSGEIAVTLLEQDQAFDLILCDMMMPKMSGMDLYDWLSTHYPHLAQCVIFITGGAFTPRANDFLNRVSNPHIEKPFEADTLLKLVRDNILATRRERIK